MINSNLTKEDLINFEKKIIQLWEDAKILYPVHFSGGNEDALIEIFKSIDEKDYVFSTHRSHYHYLLKGGSQKKLEEMILSGKSIHINDKKINFFGTGIVAGGPAIAAGVALALKYKKSLQKVWCFVGDGAEDEGHFYEAVRYVDGHKLPCTFIIEDNNRSVETPKLVRYGNSEISWPDCVIRYKYESLFPHVGTNNFVNFSKNEKGEPWM